MQSHQADSHQPSPREVSPASETIVPHPSRHARTDTDRYSRQKDRTPRPSCSCRACDPAGPTGGGHRPPPSKGCPHGGVLLRTPQTGVRSRTLAWGAPLPGGVGQLLTVVLRTGRVTDPVGAWRAGHPVLYGGRQRAHQLQALVWSPPAPWLIEWPACGPTARPHGQQKRGSVAPNPRAPTRPGH